LDIVLVNNARGKKSARNIRWLKPVKTVTYVHET
jgi:hypothetical protein